MLATRFATLGRTLGSVALRYRAPIPEQSLPSVWRSKLGTLHPIGRVNGDRDLTIEGVDIRSSRVSHLEAVLFLAREPLGSRKLALLSGLADGTEARTLVRALNRLYDDEGCAFRVVEVAGGFQLMSRAKFAPWLRRLQAVPSEVRLSAPALETLAVVAYRQPVLRADVEAVRGVQCGEILRQLMERGLVRIVGKSEELGRPFLYGTTRQFLQVFGLRDLDQLPRADWQRREPAARNERTVPDASESDRQQEMSNQLSCFNNPGGELIVKTTNHTDTVWEDELVTPAVAAVDGSDSRLAAGPEEFDEEEFEDEDEDLDDEDEDEDDDLDDDDLDDEDFEDSEWEEVEDEEDLDEDEEELEEDEEEDEDWEEDEEEDWDDEEDEDWEEEEEEEEEGE